MALLQVGPKGSARLCHPVSLWFRHFLPKCQNKLESCQQKGFFLKEQLYFNLESLIYFSVTPWKHPCGHRSQVRLCPWYKIPVAISTRQLHNQGGLMSTATWWWHITCSCWDTEQAAAWATRSSQNISKEHQRISGQSCRKVPAMWSGFVELKIVELWKK